MELAAEGAEPLDILMSIRIAVVLLSHEPKRWTCHNEVDTAVRNIRSEQV
jgi:hypothetical protein